MNYLSKFLIIVVSTLFLVSVAEARWTLSGSGYGYNSSIHIVLPGKGAGKDGSAIFVYQIYTEENQAALVCSNYGADKDVTGGVGGTIDYPAIVSTNEDVTFVDKGKFYLDAGLPLGVDDYMEELGLNYEDAYAQFKEDYGLSESDCKNNWSPYRILLGDFFVGATVYQQCDNYNTTDPVTGEFVTPIGCKSIVETNYFCASIPQVTDFKKYPEEISWVCDELP